MLQQTSQELPSTFTYSEVEANKIIQQNKGDNAFLQTATDVSLLREFERERRRYIGLDLHATTLTEYYKVGRIPRGLRVNLRPTIFRDNKEFTQKYEMIINKCSFDIILLNIDFLHREIATSSMQMDNLNDKLKTYPSTEEYRIQLKSIEDNLIKHRHEIESRKRKKFQRDELDYNSGRIYNWQRSGNERSGSITQPRSTRRRHQRETRNQRQQGRGEHRRDSSTDSPQEQRSQRPQEHGERTRELPSDRLQQRDTRDLGHRGTGGGGRDQSTDSQPSEPPTSESSASSISFLDGGHKKYKKQKGAGGGDTSEEWDQRRQPERRARTGQRH
ncbi:uncharacterized protein LOC121399975 [Xenopus laevis]|uniref:Uncharacterized protein LOC121399975 n=1 Tax=Xenopus laevis TaxID=8355 RepID=A0A8J1MA75_XENLA|nr:uncharacterized protein LOC121399975 [Xenopus laevis]